MRIISGKAKGTNLITLKGNNTRPTLDRAKEAIFNMIGINIVESNFLDLFSGSGAIGLEAASRGAKKVILCDSSKEAKKVIEKNIEKTHMQLKVKLYNLDFEKVIKEKITEKQNYIYIDPPYESNLIYKATKIIIEKNIINEDSIIIAETNKIAEVEKSLLEFNINIIDKRKYGKIEYIIYAINVSN